MSEHMMNRAIPSNDLFTAVQDFSLYQSAMKALHILESAGYECYLVGGFVRDALLGRPVHDADLACNAPYDALTGLFRERGFTAIPTSEKHGTATVLIDGTPLEITRYRVDGEYTDHRHPEHVQFVETIDQDLARRDFTINAMAYNPRTGIVDPFKGQDDLARKTIRCVGSSDARFREDALRVLRALRFSSQLGFSLENETAQAIHAHADDLLSISAERLFAEFTLLLCGENPYPLLMDFHDVIFKLVPELTATWNFDQRTPYHIYTVYDHIAHCVQAIDNTPLDRWVALLHDAGKPDAWAPDEKGQGHFPGHAKFSETKTRRIAHRFKMPHGFADDMALLVLHHDDVVEETPRAVKRMLRKLRERPDLFLHLCAMKRADTLSQAPRCIGRLEMVDNLERILEEVLEENEAFSLHDLALHGDDLISAGYKPGSGFRIALEAALDAVIDNRIENNASEIWSYWEREGILSQLQKNGDAFNPK